MSHISPTDDSKLTPRVYPRSEHCISRKDISRGALKVLYTLNEAGYDAFLVGGGVRDLLLLKHPKDFDVATNASPEQVNTLFRSSRIIGRRFRIVHVRVGPEIIEVSTFRTQAARSTEISGNQISRQVQHLDSAHSLDGMILRDNVYGSIEDDALRRDFTVNALYYTVRDFTLHDFTNGMLDLEQKMLRIIGEPEQRFREDPVRILRAIRLASKLNFTLEQQTKAAIRPCMPLLNSIPPARLFDEFLKMFFSGHGLLTFQQLLEFDLFPVLFPAVAGLVTRDDTPARRMLEGAFASTDERLSQDKSVTPAFLLAAILWPAVSQEFQHNLASGLPPMPAMQEAGQTIIVNAISMLAIPKRFSIPMREIWDYQLRLEKRNGRRAAALLEHKRFRAAYDFLLLREASGEDLDGLGTWWTQFQSAEPQSRKMMIEEQQKGQHSNPGRRKVKSARRNKGTRH